MNKSVYFFLLFIHCAVPAGIISFGKVIATSHKADVLMPCLTVGVPAPIVTWRRRGGAIVDPAR